jgi:transcriptional regulator with XRE-family HTH domain
MNIGMKLRELRLEKNLSQADLGRLTGVFRGYISRLELGYELPRLKTLERFATALDVEISQLFSVGGNGTSASRPRRAAPHLREEKTWLALFRHLSEDGGAVVGAVPGSERVHAAR